MPSAFVVGAGRLASALVPGLRAARWRVAAFARSGRGRARLRRLGATVAPLAAAARADLVFLAVPDSVIGDALLAVVPFVRRGQVVAHAAGALGLEVLDAVRATGAHPGSLHPVQALAGGPFARGVVAAVDGGATARRVLVRAARDLGLEPIRVPPRGRRLYHASAVIASNLVMALADFAAETWARSGAPPRLALAALVPLLRSAVENLAARELPGALTGPASRGDAAVVGAQARSLRGDAGEVYRLLSRRLVAIAERGGLDRERARAVLRALDRPRCAGRSGMKQRPPR